MLYRLFYNPSAFDWFLVWACFILVAVCAVVKGDGPPQQAPAIVQQAPPIKSAHPCPCWTGAGVCTCRDGCFCNESYLGCSCNPCLGNTDNYTAARLKAVAERKPLVVWVGYTCPSCVRHLKDHTTWDVIHTSVPAGFFGVTGNWINKGVVVSWPEKGDLCYLAQSAEPSGEWIASKLNEKFAKEQGVSVNITSPFVPTPPFTPGTSVPAAVPVSTAYPAGSVGVYTSTPALFAGRVGFTSGAVCVGRD